MKGIFVLLGSAFSGQEGPTTCCIHPRKGRRGQRTKVRCVRALTMTMMHCRYDDDDDDDGDDDGDDD